MTKKYSGPEGSDNSVFGAIILILLIGALVGFFTLGMKNAKTSTPNRHTIEPTLYDPKLNVACYSTGGSNLACVQLKDKPEKN